MLPMCSSWCSDVYLAGSLSTSPLMGELPLVEIGFDFVCVVIVLIHVEE